MMQQRFICSYELDDEFKNSFKSIGSIKAYSFEVAAEEFQEKNMDFSEHQESEVVYVKNLGTGEIKKFEVTLEYDPRFDATEVELEEK